MRLCVIEKFVIMLLICNYAVSVSSVISVPTLMYSSLLSLQLSLVFMFIWQNNCTYSTIGFFNSFVYGLYSASLVILFEFFFLSDK